MLSVSSRSCFSVCGVDNAAAVVVVVAVVVAVAAAAVL